MTLRLALYQPDIPQNVGAILRTAACFGVAVDVVEPCGFVWDEKRMRRAGMDYRDLARVHRHTSWPTFLAQRATPSRVVLLTTQGATNLHDFTFKNGDYLLLGRESAGVPESVHTSADARVTIPMVTGVRSLNVAQSAAVALVEALRQLGTMPGGSHRQAEGTG